jgi:hypothetical protein
MRRGKKTDSIRRVGMGIGMGGKVVGKAKNCQKPVS